MRRLALLSLAFLLGACPGDVDFDGDGQPDATDCAPEDPEVYLGAPDSADNGIDNDCDGTPGVDNDADGHASVASGGDDCNDDDSGVHPGQEEIPDNSDDEDCSGGPLYCDVDEDTFRASVAVCGGDDCDDLNALVNPGAIDAWGDELDLNCDGIDGLDEDRDGHRSPTQLGDDCNDGDASVYPGAPEVCGDGVDQDCTGADRIADEDGDGHASTLCGGGDCDDSTALVHPDRDDPCDNLDNDCDGEVDEGADLDGDGFCAGDCHDQDPDRFPGNLAEVDGDGFDSSCDGEDWLGLGAGPAVVTSPERRFGCTVRVVGDVDGDGIDDWAVGAPGAPSNDDDGEVRLFLGGTMAPATAFESNAAHAVVRGDTDSQLGREEFSYPRGGVARAGDLDGDGLDDVWIAAPRDDGGVVGELMGKLMLFTGAQLAAGGEYTAADAAVSIGGLALSGDQMFGGGALLGGDDLDGDGVPDLIVGSPCEYASLRYQGQVRFFSGAAILAGEVLTASDAQGSFKGDRHDRVCGSDVVLLPDFDFDGTPEVAISCGGDVDYQIGDDRYGRIIGLSGALLTQTVDLSYGDSFFQIVGDETLAARGHSLAVGGDFDGDGWPELAFTSGSVLPEPGDEAYSARIMPSSVLAMGGTIDPWLAPWSVATVGTYRGSHLAWVEDQDGDGHPELLAADPLLPADLGALRMWSSQQFVAGGAALGPEDAMVTWIGEAEAPIDGADFALGDVDGSGRLDLLVGAPRDDPNNPEPPSRVYVLLDFGR